MCKHTIPNISLCLLGYWLMTGCCAAFPMEQSIPPQWRQAAQQQIEAMEYQVQCSTVSESYGKKNSWQAPNRANGFRAVFSANGPVLQPRRAGEAQWRWGLELSKFGAARNLSTPPEVVTVHADGNRFEYRRKNGLVEWYRNTPEGFEQGFTLYEAPAGDEEVTLEIVVQGNLLPCPGNHANAIGFSTAAGVRILQYDGLKAWDRSGRNLAANLEMLPSNGIADAAPAAIRITVDAHGAAYPITTDPLITSPAWTSSAHQAYARWGAWVTGAGDINGDGYDDVIIGAPYYDHGEENEGLVFVFHGSPTGLPIDASWSAEANQEDAHLGSSAAAAGDINGDGYGDIIIGAPNFDGAQSNSGRVYVHYGSQNGLMDAPAWIADAEEANAQFGIVVAGVGDVNGDGYADVMASAPRGASNQGYVAVYFGSPAGLPPTPNWIVQGDQLACNFGAAAAGAGDVNGDGFHDIIIGAFTYDNGGSDEGRAWLYYGSATGISSTPAWSCEGDQDHAWLGGSVAGAGDVNGDGFADIIVGAYGYDVPPSDVDAGEALLFLGSESGLTPLPSRSLPGTQANARFAYAVAGAGDINGDGFADIIIGAQFHDAGQTDEGKAFLYFGSGEGLLPAAAWSGESDQELARYGNSVAGAGDINGDGFGDIIVGASNYTLDDTHEGMAYAYYGAASGLSAEPAWENACMQASAQYGYSLAGAGDINGDGYDDFAVGAPFYDNGLGAEGRVFLFRGTSSGPDSTPAWAVSGSQLDAQFGFALSMAGDLNGDGYGDLAVGAPYFDGTGNDTGRIYLYQGSPAGLPLSPSLILEGDQPGENLGYSVAAAGDVNGDGLGDLLAGSPSYDDAYPEEGRTQLYLGDPSGLSATPAWTVTGQQNGARLGAALASAGDINRDARSDVVIGVPGYSNAYTHAGAALAYFGNAEGLNLTPIWMGQGEQNGANYGACVSPAGDVNGDGYADILIGEPHYANAQINEGRAHAYYGSPAGFSSLAQWKIEGGQADGLLGHALAGAGDVNGDGFGDVLIGAPGFSGAYAAEGRMTAFLGSSTGLCNAPSWEIQGEQAGAQLGYALSPAGDVNGDGYADMLGGAPLCDTPLADTGRIGLFYGNAEAAKGARIHPRQLQADASSPIAPLGNSGGSGEITLAAWGRSPYGRTKVRLECEMKPYDRPFNGENTVVSPLWLDTGLSGTELTQLITGLAPDQPYHWRIRWRYWPGHAPLQSASRWVCSPYPGPLDIDFRTASSPIATPANPGAQQAAANRITWVWDDNSSNEIGFRIWVDPGASPPATERTTVPAQTTAWIQNNLAPNTEYAFQIAAFTISAQSPRSTLFTAWTSTNTPLAPLISNPEGYSLDIAIDTSDGNPLHTLYAIQIAPPLFGRQWVQSNGATGDNPVFQTAASWNRVTVNNLDEMASYAFRATAQNGAGANTGPGPAATGTTRDITPPTAQIVLLSPALTAANAIEFRVTFSESVGNSFMADRVSPAAGALPGTIVIAGAAVPNQYALTILLTDPNADGVVRLEINGGVTDLSGNAYAGGLSPSCQIRNWPGFTEEPQDAALYVGGGHRLRVVINSPELPTSCQWKWKNTQNRSYYGPASETWNLANAALANEGRYWCEVTYDGEIHTSRQALITVRDHVRISLQPRGDLRPVGGSYVFRTQALGGYAPLTYLWTRNNHEAGYEETLYLNDLELADAGSYQAIATDAFGDYAVSEAAYLRVAVKMTAMNPLALYAAITLIAAGAAFLALRKRRS